MRKAILLLAAATAVTLPAVFPARCAPAPGANRNAFGNIGTVQVDARSNVITPAAIVYNDAHMRTDNGATLDCRTLQGNLNKSGSGFTTCVATGDVRAHVKLAGGDTYDIAADKAVYDVAANEIDLTGSPVRAVAATSYTKGPLVQTGDSGVVLLGPSPKYPDIAKFPAIVMNNVHTQFTPSEQPSPSDHANPR